MLPRMASKSLFSQRWRQTPHLRLCWGGSHGPLAKQAVFPLNRMPSWLSFIIHLTVLLKIGFSLAWACAAFVLWGFPICSFWFVLTGVLQWHLPSFVHFRKKSRRQEWGTKFKKVQHRCFAINGFLGRSSESWFLLLFFCFSVTGFHFHSLQLYALVSLLSSVLSSFSRHQCLKSKVNTPPFWTFSVPSCKFTVSHCSDIPSLRIFPFR